MSVRILVGDMRERLRELPDASVDSCVTDPPYHLTSIVKRFGSAAAAPAKVGQTGAYARASKGFMGQTWDGGAVAFDPETWVEVARVLKPGAHLVAFSGTRTYHRMACAIEDAGFEIRDQLAWVYGSGFPKSHDVSKGIDRIGGAPLEWFGPWLRQWREERGVSQADLAAHFPSKSGGKTGCVSNWELGVRTPTADDFNLLCRALDLPFADIEEAARDVIGKKGGDPERFKRFAEQDGNERRTFNNDVTAAATPEAREWEGWGTALKPAWEPICLARKPLVGTVAGNVLQHGTGAINIDGCRVATDESITCVQGGKAGGGFDVGSSDGTRRTEFEQHSLGRWPANIIHDGSEEVLAGFPETHSTPPGNIKPSPSTANACGEYRERSLVGHTDSGSAARFFYSAKVTSAERGEGNNHPTVKPVDLMRWLCRLVTPRGGTVLDPFAGSGSTLIAADAEQFHAIGCELSPEYAAIAERRFRDSAGLFAEIAA